MPPCRVNLGQVPGEAGQALVGGLLLQHLAVTDDGIEGSTQLVTHIRQEGAFRAVGGLGGFFGPAQFFIDPLALGYILDTSLVAKQVIILVVNGAGVLGNPDYSAIAVVDLDLVVADKPVFVYQIQDFFAPVGVGVMLAAHVINI